MWNRDVRIAQLVRVFAFGGSVLAAVAWAGTLPTVAVPASGELAEDVLFAEGSIDVPELFIPEGVSLTYYNDLHIRSTGDVVIDGRIVGVNPLAMVGGRRHGASLIIESPTKIVVRGFVQGAPGRHGALSAEAVALLRATDAHPIVDVPELIVPRLVEAVRMNAPAGDLHVLFAGGEGGVVTLRAPIVWVDGLVRGGDAGDGGPAGDGGRGGWVVIDGPCLTSCDDEAYEVVAGNAGHPGGAYRGIADETGGDGGDGGSAIAWRHIPPGTDLTPPDGGTYASSVGTPGTAGGDVTGTPAINGIDGLPGVDCFNPIGTDGTDGGQGGDAHATDGSDGGSGRSGCPNQNGKVGGAGGRGGKGTGTIGGKGGDGGPAYLHPDCCGACGGAGGDAGDGGSGFGGTGGKGGNGGHGCPTPGGAGAGGRPGAAIKGGKGAVGVSGEDGSCASNCGGDGLVGVDGGQTPGGEGNNGGPGALCPGCGG